MEVTLIFKEENDGTCRCLSEPIEEIYIPEWSELYFILTDEKNPLHFLFRSNKDFLVLSEYLDSCGVSKSRPDDGVWIPVYDPAALFGEGDIGIISYYKCSVCGRREATKEPFCNCGAKMRTE